MARPNYHHKAKETRYMDVDLDHGAGNGNTLSWRNMISPGSSDAPVEIQVDLDTEKFYKMFVDLLTPTPAAPQRTLVKDS